MKIIECKGTSREIGLTTGEASREEIRRFLEMSPVKNAEAWQRRLPHWLDAMQAGLPHIIEEMDATAEAAGVEPEDIYRLNFPMYPHDLHLEGCTNVVFTAGTDGPLWGKNNDGNPPENARPRVIRIIRHNNGVPAILIHYAGLVGVCDGINAEGVAMGHSSVGSVFQQSDHHLPIRPWGYWSLQQSRSAEDFVRQMASIPTRGKGHSLVCADASGAACSLEAPCPVVQVRRPDNPRGVYCVNAYLLPQLADADRRTPACKADALQRRDYLEEVLAADGPFDVERMKQLLRCHREPVSICRHGEVEAMYTEYSTIGVLSERKMLACEGYPCEGEYEEVSL